ncbi:MAG: serine protease [Propionibacteriaceae bacterium]|jgi:adenylate kinase family enzyme|nr:serine protease [Propionibacteriaceae bacterium]
MVARRAVKLTYQAPDTRPDSSVQGRIVLWGGSGWRLGRGLILTAGHCSGAGTTNHQVKTTDGTVHDAQVVWTSPRADVDLALWRVEALAEDETTPLVLLDRHSADLVNATGFGYPAFLRQPAAGQPTAPQREQLNGTISPAHGEALGATASPLYFVTDPTNTVMSSGGPGDWQALSGASVLVDHEGEHHCVGVVRSHHREHAANVFELTGFDSLLRLLSTTEAAGFWEHVTWVKPDTMPVLKGNHREQRLIWTHLCPAEAPHYVTRQALTELKDALRDFHRATLWGLKGAGKSQIAAALVRQCENEGWSEVLWVNAEDRTSLLSDLKHIAMIIDQGNNDLEPEKAAAWLISHWNSNQSRRRLIVFDDLTNLDDLTGHIPEPAAATVIITIAEHSAAPDENQIPLIEVEPFTESEARNYLGNRTNLGDLEGANQVAERLSRLPLALSKAADVINLRNEYDPNYGYSEYLDDLAAQPMETAPLRHKRDYIITDSTIPPTLSKLLKALFPYFTSASMGVEYFTCVFLDAITNWRYFYYDDHLEKGGSEFKELMHELFFGTTDPPPLLTRQIQLAMKNEYVIDFINNFFDAKRDELLQHFNFSKEDPPDAFHEFLSSTLHAIFNQQSKLKLTGGSYEDLLLGKDGIPYVSELSPSTLWINFSDNSNRATSEQQNRFNEKNRTASLCGRFNELNCLIDFCNVRVPNQHFLWFAISGVGGSGKSRLSRELMEWITYTESDWKAAILREPDIEQITNARSQIANGNKTIIILDHYKWYMNQLKEITNWLFNDSETYATEVRLLLIERDPVDKDRLPWDRDVKSTQFIPRINSAAYLDHSGLMIMLPLDDIVLSELIDSYARGVGANQTVDETTVLKLLQDFDKGFKIPLFVQFIADAVINGSEVRGWNRERALEYALDSEFDYLRHNCESYGTLTGPELESLVRLCRTLLIVASLAGSLPWKHVLTLFPDEYNRLNRFSAMVELNSPRALLSECLGYSVIEEILPIQPDLIGEYYILTAFRKMNTEERRHTIRVAAEVDFNKLFERCNRIRSDFWHLLDRLGLLEHFLEKSLIDARMGDPFLVLDGHAWDRIDKDNSRRNDYPALLISRYIILRERYHSSEHSGVSWETSYLRTLLNGPVRERLEKSLSESYPDLFLMEGYDSSGVNDKVFILNQNEIRRYYDLPLDSMDSPEPGSNTLVAIDVSPEGDERPRRWWLRSEGYAFIISNYGSIYNYDHYFDDADTGVRPVFWVDRRKTLGEICIMNNTSVNDTRIQVRAGIIWSTQNRTRKIQLRKMLEPRFAIAKHYLIELWDSDTDSLAGLPADQYLNELAASHIIILLVSPDMLASKVVQNLELKIAANKIRIPVGLVRVPLTPGALWDSRVTTDQLVLDNGKFFAELRGTSAKETFADQVVRQTLRRLDEENLKAYS